MRPLRTCDSFSLFLWPSSPFAAPLLLFLPPMWMTVVFNFPWRFGTLYFLFFLFHELLQHALYVCINVDILMVLDMVTLWLLLLKHYILLKKSVIFSTGFRSIIIIIQEDGVFFFVRNFYYHIIPSFSQS